MDITATQSALSTTASGRLWRGLGSSALAQVIAAGNAILMVPLFLWAWGAQGYGRWISLTAMLSYLTLLDLGGQNFIGNILTDAYIRGDERKFRQYSSEGVSLFVFISTVGFVFMLGFLMIPGLTLPGQDIFLGMEDRLVVLLLGANMLIAIPGGVYVTAYRATGLFTRGTMVGNILRIGGFVFLALFLAAGFPPAVYAGAMLVTGIVGTLTVVQDIRKRVPSIRGINLGLSSARAGRIHLKGSLYFWVLSLATALNFQGVILVLGASAPSSSVALYATHRTASGMVGYVGNIILSPLWPELTFLHAQERRKELANITLLVIKAVVLLSGAVAIGIWLFLPLLYPAWTGRQLDIQPSLLGLFLFQAVLMAGWSTAGWPLLASNQHSRLARWSLLNAGLTVMLAIALAPRFGVIGVAFATLTGDVLCGAAIYPFLAAKTLNVATSKVYGAILRPLFVLLPAGIFLYYVASKADGWKAVGIVFILAIVMAYPVVRLSLGNDNLSWMVTKLRELRRNPS